MALSLWRFCFLALPMMGLGLSSARPSTSCPFVFLLPTFCWWLSFLCSPAPWGGFHLQEISFGSFGVFRESKISYVCSVVILDSELNLLLHLS